MEDAGPAYERQILSESEINSCNSSGSEYKTKPAGRSLFVFVSIVPGHGWMKYLSGPDG